MKQHAVPSSYLARWCDPGTPKGYDPFIWLFDKEGRTGKARAPHKVFRKSHRYTDRRPAATNPLWVEKGFSKLEADFAACMRRIESDANPISAQDKATLALFAAALYVRTAPYIEHTRRQWGRALVIGEELAARLKRTPAARPVPAIVPPGTSLTLEQVRDLVRHPMQTIGPAAMFDRARRIAKMPCVIFNTPSRPGFITSDVPCFLQDPPTKNGEPLASPEAEVSVPLSPHYLALFAWWLAEDRERVEAPEILVNTFNQRTRLSCAQQYIACQREALAGWFKSW